MTTFRTLPTFGALVLAAGLLVACGDDRDAEGELREVEDAFGPTQVPVEPQRILADSVSTYAHLMSLGVTPEAVAMPMGISPEYIAPDAGEITNVVADDGWTIDVEQAVGLDPDLIVGVGADYNEENCDRYREVTSTFCFVDYYDTLTDEDIRNTLNGIAAAIGREDEAAQALADYDERLAALAERVAATDLPNHTIGVVRVDAGGFIGIRTDDWSISTIEGLGMSVPEWPEATVDGYVELSLETLEVLDQADILLVTTDDDVVIEESTVFQSPLWQNLDVVKDGRTHFVGAWNGSDLPQLNRVLDDLDRELVTPAEA